MTHAMKTNHEYSSKITRLPRPANRPFNIPVTPPFIFAGVLFGLPLAILYRFRIVLAIALAALAVAVSATTFQVAGTEWTYAFIRLEVLAVAGFSLLVLAIPLSAVDDGFVMVTRLVALTLGLGCLWRLHRAARRACCPWTRASSKGCIRR